MRLETQNTRTLRLAHNTGSAVRFTPARGPQGLPGPGSAAWAADTAVTTGTVRQAPDGSWIKSTGNRTTRPTFDATEATFWEAVLASSGTVEATALTVAIASGAAVFNVKDYGATGDGTTNDTAAIQAACDAVPAEGGTVLFPPGDYLCRLVRPGSYTTLRGDGATLKYRATGAAAFDAILAWGDSSAVGGITTSSNLRGITIDGLTFRGNGDTLGINENQALVHFSGVSDAVVTRCQFIGMQGDGIYIGATSSAATERHNERIKVYKNVFDGLGNHGRQGVSIIEGSSITIDDNDFRNLATSTMPGAVDIEPNPLDATAIIRDITITNNRFQSIGGNVADIAMVFLPATFTNGAPQRIICRGNTHVDSGKAAYYVDWLDNPTSGSDPHQGIEICDNIIGPPDAGAAQAILVRSARGVRIAGNTITGWANTPIYCCPASTTVGLDLTISGNTLIDSGGTGSVAIQLGYVTNAIVENNVARKSGTALAALAFLVGSATSSNIQIRNNVASGVTADSVSGASHTTTTTTNQSFGNVGMTQVSTDFAGAPTVTGAKAGNAALTSLIAQLVAHGLIKDSTT